MCRFRADPSPGDGVPSTSPRRTHAAAQSQRLQLAAAWRRSRQPQSPAPRTPRPPEPRHDRLPVKKTYKLYIGGAFPRSESGRSYEAEGQNVARASRKDVTRRRPRGARRVPGLVGADRVQPRADPLPPGRDDGGTRRRSRARRARGSKEVEAAIDRVVWYAGWADKLAQTLGSSNPVAGPYFDFTVPEPTGVVATLAPPEPALGGLVSRIVPPLVGGNTVVAVASESHPLAAIELAEALATSDVPGGAVNILTGFRDELAPGSRATWT